MPSGQILYLMMFVGKCSCTSHVLQYSSSLSYEHSRSLQSILCPGVVTVLICSFFVAALLLIYRNLENGGKIIHIFTNRQTFSYLFCIFSQFYPRKNWIFRIILVFVFNHQVGNTGWSSMRAYHDQALIDEFKRRGIDVSAVYDGKAIFFTHPVRYELPDNKLIAIG